MRTLSSRVVYRNRWMSVREDRITREDGPEGTYAVVDKPDFALVIPYENDGFWLVEQFRYPIRRRAWEFPQGSWNAVSGAPEDLARAELAEETGLLASQVENLGHLYGAYGFCSQGFGVYLIWRGHLSRGQAKVVLGVRRQGGVVGWCWHGEAPGPGGRRRSL